MPLPEDLPTPAFLDRFRAVSGDAAALRFDRFVELALYDPQVGYYRRDRPRVGRGPGTDFYTATTSGPLFGELIVAACESLLGRETVAAYRFVEIGAEPQGGVLAGVAHPFASTTTLQVGSPVVLSGPSVVFSNELFDAQPFRRFIRRNGAWQELGVELAEGQLREVLWLSGPEPIPSELPAQAVEGYRLDLSFAAVELAAQIAAQPWHGLFLAFDYGKPWPELAGNTPGGTARAYHRHQQSNDLLARPGDQDLTCHVCWDWISRTLAKHGFGEPELEFQESFFVHHAADLIGKTLAAEATRLSPRKLALMQLLHPTHLGQKFQALHALRRPNSR